MIWNVNYSPILCCIDAEVKNFMIEIRLKDSCTGKDGDSTNACHINECIYNLIKSHRNGEKSV